MFTSMKFSRVLCLALLLGWTPAAPRAAAQDDRRPEDESRSEERSPQRRGRFSRDPEDLRRRIEELREEDPNDPRIQRLEQILKRLESRRDAELGDASESGPDRPGGPRFTEEQVQDFLKAHPELGELFRPGAGRPPRETKDGESAKGQGPHGRPGPDRPALHRIMEAFEEGDVQRGELMINSATIQKQIRRTMRGYRDAEREADAEAAAALRQELRALVERQVRLEHEIKGLELTRLRERLEDQTRRHEQQAGRLDQVVQQRLESLLDRDPPQERRGEGLGPRPGRRGVHDRPGGGDAGPGEEGPDDEEQ